MRSICGGYQECAESTWNYIPISCLPPHIARVHTRAAHLHSPVSRSFQATQMYGFHPFQPRPRRFAGPWSGTRTLPSAGATGKGTTRCRLHAVLVASESTHVIARNPAEIGYPRLTCSERYSGPYPSWPGFVDSPSHSTWRVAWRVAGTGDSPHRLGHAPCVIRVCARDMAGTGLENLSEGADLRPMAHSRHRRLKPSRSVAELGCAIRPGPEVVPRHFAPPTRKPRVSREVPGALMCAPRGLA